jgi:hypothetical protein
MTTFGNTIRVISMYRFLLYKAGIKEYRMSVGGDDFFIILLAQDKLKFQNAVAYYFST